MAFLRPLPAALIILTCLAWVERSPDTAPSGAADPPPLGRFAQLVSEQWVVAMTVISVYMLWGHGEGNPSEPASSYSGGESRVKRTVPGTVGLLICLYVDGVFAWILWRNFLYAIIFMTVVHAFG